MPPFAEFLVIVALIWCIGGWGAYSALADAPKSLGLQVLIVAITGPLVWAILAWRGFNTLRRRILTQFGVAHYSCCGGRHGSTEADRLHNHPPR